MFFHRIFVPILFIIFNVDFFDIKTTWATPLMPVKQELMFVDSIS